MTKKPTAEPNRKTDPPIDAAAEAADALGLDADDIRRAMKIIEGNRKARRREAKK